MFIEVPIFQKKNPALAWNILGKSLKNNCEGVEFW